MCSLSIRVSCTGGAAAALVNLEIIEREKLVTNSRVMGDVLREGLRELQRKYMIIGDVRGLGLFQVRDSARARAGERA